MDIGRIPRADVVIFIPDSQKDFIEVNGKRIYLAISRGDYLESRATSGTVVATPDKWLEDMIPIEKGDKIIFNYNTVTPHNTLNNDNYLFTDKGQDYYHVLLSEIHFVVHNGAIRSFWDYILVEPITESWEDIQTASGIYIKTAPEKIAQRGTIKTIGDWKNFYGKYSGWENVEVGDTVYFDESADIPVMVGDQKMYVMRYRNILGVEKNGEFIPLGDKVFVKDSDTPRQSGLIHIPDSAKPDNQHHASEVVVMTGGGLHEPISVRPGDKVLFQLPGSSEIKIKGEKYRVFREMVAEGVWYE